MKITLQYRSENVNPEQRSYYKYISQDYKDLDDQSLVRTIIETNNKLKIYRMFFYLIFGGLGIMMLSSFYMRVVVRR